MSLTIEEFFHLMDHHAGRVPIGVLTRRLQDLEIGFDDVQPVVRFSNDHYRRNLWREGDGYHGLILCWKNGQRSPIHDHRGSSCGVRVLKGVATETLFERSANGLVYPTRTRELPPGSVTGSCDADIHQVSNLQGGDADLVTLHVYSPTLHVMGTYSLTDPLRREIVDPIFEFAAGTGI